MYGIGKCAQAVVDADKAMRMQDREVYYGLISNYEKLVPHLAPQDVRYVLWHPDIEAQDILVTNTTHPRKVTGILNWCSALVAPHYTNITTPSAYDAEDHPLIDSSSPVHDYFPAREWAVRLPAFLLVVGLTAIGLFVGSTIVKENRKKAQKARLRTA